MDANLTVYENGNARLEVRETPDGLNFWIQSGVAGLSLDATDLADLYEIIDAYIQEFDDE